MTAELLNDDTPGKALDALYACDVSALYSLIAARAVRRLGLYTQGGPSGHHPFPRRWPVQQPMPRPPPEAGVARITRDYSRDGKPDLNQVALELIHEHQAHLPIALQALDGNQNDKTTMQTSVSQHIAQLRQVGIEVLVKDSAGYTRQAIEAHEAADLKWITRVPATPAEAKTLLETSDPHIF